VSRGSGNLVLLPLGCCWINIGVYAALGGRPQRVCLPEYAAVCATTHMDMTQADPRTLHNSQAAQPDSWCRATLQGLLGRRQAAAAARATSFAL